jgi:hypothetical protein
MLFGKAGVGKSATANTLSGITVFKSERSASSVTVQPQAVDFGYNGISYRIVDTVGLDPALFKNIFGKKRELFESIVRDFRAAIELTKTEKQQGGGGGINCLLICISARERVTFSETLLICTCAKLFNKEIRGHCILVVTNADEFEERKEYEEWLQNASSNAHFQDVVNACNGMVYPISNRRPPEWVTNARHDILSAIALKDKVILRSIGASIEFMKVIQLISTPYNNEEGGCIACGQVVSVLRGKAITNIKIEALKQGDTVLTNSGFSRYVGELHSPESHSVVVFHFEDGNTLMVTANHVVQRGDGAYVLAKEITLDMSIGKRRIKAITQSQTQVCSPLTQSGTLIVNEAPVSCFSVISHWLGHMAFVPLSLLSSLGIDTDLQEYTLGLCALYAALPSVIRRRLPVYL